MGDWSTSTTRSILPKPLTRLCAPGDARAENLALAAFSSTSFTSVDLPEPDTPDADEAAERKGDVDRLEIVLARADHDRIRLAHRARASGTGTKHRPDRYAPVRDCRTVMRSSTPP